MMTRSEILSIARKVLRAYGFKPIKNKFYLDLEEVFMSLLKICPAGSSAQNLKA